MTEERGVRRERGEIRRKRERWRGRGEEVREERQRGEMDRNSNL